MTFGNDNSVTLNNEGNNSGIAIGTNTGTVNYGLTYSEIRDLCLDLIKGEISKYVADGLVEAQKRYEELFNLLIAELQKIGFTDLQILNEFKNPGMQIDYYEAQKGYIRVGTPQLSKLLSAILVKRIHETSRSMLQLTLSEAIRIAPKLLSSHMAVLALIVAIGELNVNLSFSRDQFILRLKQLLIPLFQSGVSQQKLEIYHLDFTGCLQMELWSEPLINLLKKNYSFFFMKGFLPEDLQKDEKGDLLNDVYPDLFTKCLNNKELLQVNALNESDLTSKLGDNQKHFKILHSIFRQNMMSDDESQRLVESLLPEMKDVFTYWNNSLISSCRLSPVGAVIGAEYLRQITGKSVDISEWF